MSTVAIENEPQATPIVKYNVSDDTIRLMGERLKGLAADKLAQWCLDCEALRKLEPTG